MATTAELFSPFPLGGVTLPNRIAVSPMCQYSCVDGFATDWHLVHLGSRAVGGAGLVVVEASAVSPEGRITPGDLGVWKDEHCPKLRQIVEFIHSQGAAAGIQLAHAGRKASMAVPWEKERLLSPNEGGWTDMVAPSAVSFSETYGKPRELDGEGVKKVKADFAAAAVRALQTGFDAIEIHAAHGYLFHEFLSPLSNLRQDQYGGSFENRTRLLLEVTSELRRIVPATKALLVRISATDWTESGWTLEDSIELSKRLKDLGVDLIDVSSGGNVAAAQIPVGPGYQTPFAAAIRQNVGIPTAAVGMITSPAQADQIIRSGHADLVFLARELLRDPYWPLHAAQELHRTTAWPPQYLRAAGRDVPSRQRFSA